MNPEWQVHLGEKSPITPTGRLAAPPRSCVAPQKCPVCNNYRWVKTGKKWPWPTAAAVAAMKGAMDQKKWEREYLNFPAV